ncbi:MAG: TolC family protein, partial [Synergistes sp.]|nr:TolC family protein [Synergistes sp.]
MKRAVVKCTAALALIFISAAASFAETLTLEECLAAAMAYNPNIVAAREKIASTRETINQAASTGRPQVSANAGYGRDGMGLSSDNNFGSYTGNVKVDQSISDWGRRETKIAGAKLNTEAASADYEAIRKDVIRDVYIAYYELNRSVRESGVAKTRYENYEKRLKWARDFYEVGTKAKIEVTRAEADLAASKLTVVRSDSAIEQYKANLANIIGRPMLTINDAVDMLAFEEWDVPLDDAVKNAMERRPELTAKRRR